MRTYCMSGIVAVLVGVAGSAASAQLYNLTDGNSTAHFDTGALAPGSRVGMDQWVVDGVNHMYSQWFWIRSDGDAQEQRINALPFMAGGTSDTNFNGQDETLFLRYGAANTYTVETTFGLQGGTAGSRTSDVTEQIRVTNFSTSQRHFSFFQYSDFDLNNDILDDSVAVVNPNAVQQIDLLTGTVVAESIITPTYSFSEVSTYSLTLTKLDDGLLDNLNGSVGPLVGRADYTWAFQWDFVLNPGASFLISKDKRITPAPGAIALLGLGGLAFGRRRRN
jgi:hypothetical protein